MQRLHYAGYIISRNDICNYKLILHSRELDKQACVLCQFVETKNRLSHISTALDYQFLDAVFVECLLSTD